MPEPTQKRFVAVEYLLQSMTLNQVYIIDATDQNDVMQQIARWGYSYNIFCPAELENGKKIIRNSGE